MFKEGDTVRLKSGSPKMTIIKIDQVNKIVECTWVDGDGHQQTGTFPLDGLELD